MANTWALIVGIRKYAHPETDELLGADIDVQATEQYLRNELQVPSNNICILRDGQATRAGIIDAFRRHLIDNDQIRFGDPILFHFSGHGSQCEAPDGWPVIDRQDGQPGLLELIIPYDEGTQDKDGYDIYGIPDRTLGALLAALAKRRGENITVVLDCCNSGHGTRSGTEGEEALYSVRGIDPKRITPLRADVDRDIWGPLSRGDVVGGYSRAGFTTQRAKSHVLIAACGQKETAMGSKKGGGVLTSLWLKALRNPNIHPRSYSQLLKVVSRDIDELRKKHDIIKQHPQCEGISRDRLVFQQAALDPRFFGVEVEKGAARCKVSAGEVHGVKIGTTFELYEVNPHSQKVGRTLGTAVAKSVDSTHCFVELARGVQLSGNGYSARIVDQVNPLRYALLNVEPNSPEALAIFTRIEDSLRDPMPPEIQRVLDHDEVDLILEVDGRDRGGVTLQRRDPTLRHLNTYSPRLDYQDVLDANFPHLLNAIARFNTYLSKDSTIHPFARDIEVEFHLLQPDPDLDYLGDSVLTEARALEREILPKNDEFTIQQVDMDDYAFILRNSGSQPLYVYVVYFDAGTYEISVWHSPATDNQPTLLPKGVLQVGASPEHADPFTFFIRPGDETDTSFIKIFLLDSYTRMSFMAQEPQIGHDERGRRYLQARRTDTMDLGVANPPRKGMWDCITRQINVIRGN